MISSKIAQVVHEANRAVQIIQNDPTIPVSPHWEELDMETKKSAEQGVQGVLAGNNPEQSHAGWVEFKLNHGWVWGTHKDEIARTHPLLVPYDELPKSQKIKDELFVAIVKVLANAE